MHLIELARTRKVVRTLSRFTRVLVSANKLCGSPVRFLHKTYKKNPRARVAEMKNLYIEKKRTNTITK